MRQQSPFRNIFRKLNPIKRRSLWLLMPLALASVLFLGWLFNLLAPQLGSGEYLEQILRDSGWFAPFLYIILIIISVVISPIPGSCLAMIGGSIWPPALALVYTLVGGFLGATLAYFIGRKLGQEGFKALTTQKIEFFKHRGNLSITGLIFFCRLFPIVSFDLVSYGAGAIGVPFPLYALATLLGMTPSTFLITYLGATISINWVLALKFALPVAIVLSLARVAVPDSK